MKHMFIGLADILLNRPSNYELSTGTRREEEFKDVSQRIKKLAAGRFEVRYLFNFCRTKDFGCYWAAFDKFPWWKNSDVVVMNVMVHHLEAHIAEKNNTEVYLQNLRRLFSLNAKLTWATGPAYDITKVPSAYQFATKNRPTYRANFESFKLAKEYGIPILDFFSLTATCTWANCTADGGHRSRFVNRMKVQLLLNNICNADSLGAFQKPNVSTTGTGTSTSSRPFSRSRGGGGGGGGTLRASVAMTSPAKERQIAR